MTSRYADQPTETRSWRGTLVRSQSLRPNKSWSFNFTLHQIKDGDRIDLIAYRYYNDASLWWMVADANPEILAWHDLSPGFVIRIPNV
ncbi:LysM peptidoglycan-binding domain-containing protein [Nonomuraea sp. NPDC059023]|uniref:LysM peptidoglycan-binding domain-containing protein n=1 Tax=unclassified Nonomuraea TaxID=2593643 RepID=UPI0036CF3E99